MKLQIISLYPALSPRKYGSYFPIHLFRMKSKGSGIFGDNDMLIKNLWKPQTPWLLLLCSAFGLSTIIEYFDVKPFIRLLWRRRSSSFSVIGRGAQKVNSLPSFTISFPLLWNTSSPLLKLAHIFITLGNRNHWSYFSTLPPFSLPKTQPFHL